MIFYLYCRETNFSQKVTLPSDVDVEYRFFVAVICLPNGTKNSAETLIIRHWETHMPPRIIKQNCKNKFSFIEI